MMIRNAFVSTLLALGNEAKARQFVADIHKRVPVLDSGARGSTTTFVERGHPGPASCGMANVLYNLLLMSLI